jgi:hypothetical protein
LTTKTALDILRVLQATETSVLAATVVRLLQADVRGILPAEALLVLRDQFTDPPRGRLADGSSRGRHTDVGKTKSRSRVRCSLLTLCKPSNEAEKRDLRRQ